jgi:hypothetical protein
MITFKEVYADVDEQVLSEQMQQDVNLVKAKGAEMVARVFAARNAAHMAHLLTPSYAQHIALGDFYDGIIPLVDSFAENLMGRFGRFDSFPNVKESSIDGLIICGNLTKWVDVNRAAFEGLSEIQNIVDELLSLTNSTAYKLRELK